jgi:hypothetical protein
VAVTVTNLDAIYSPTDIQRRTFLLTRTTGLSVVQRPRRVTLVLWHATPGALHVAFWALPFTFGYSRV